MKHIRQIGLTSDDMNIIVDLVCHENIIKVIGQTNIANEYKGNINRAKMLYFLNNDIHSINSKAALKKIYREINEKIVNIQLQFEIIDLGYEEKLKSKKLRELRELFSRLNLTNNELRAIPILLKCMDIEYNNNIAFMLENELYIRSRIEKETLSIDKNNEEDSRLIKKLQKDIKDLENKIKIKNNTILTLDEINKELKLELEFEDKDIGYFEELTTEDYTKIIKDLGDHNTKVREQFKGLLKEFEADGSHTVDQLYELWMKWTDDEVTVIDNVLKKSIYHEKIKRSDINELEDISENIMNRHLLSRILLHFIYRRMASQCFEEVMGV